MFGHYGNKDFLVEISKIKDPVTFIGLAKLCGAQLTDTTKVNAAGHAPARDFSAILDDIMTKYSTLGRKKRREVMKMLRAANAAPQEDNDGSRTKDN